MSDFLPSEPSPRTGLYVQALHLPTPHVQSQERLNEGNEPEESRLQKVSQMFKQMWVLKNDLTFIHHLGMLSHVQLFVTPWTVACQAPLSMEFPRQEYWSGCHFPSPGDLPDPGTKPTSLTSSTLVGGFFTTAPPGRVWSTRIERLPLRFTVEVVSEKGIRKTLKSGAWAAARPADGGHLLTFQLRSLNNSQRRLIFFMEKKNPHLPLPTEMERKWPHLLWDGRGRVNIYGKLLWQGLNLPWC